MKLARVLAASFALVAMVTVSVQAGGDHCAAAKQTGVKQASAACAASSASCAAMKASGKVCASGTMTAAACNPAQCDFTKGGNCCQASMTYTVKVNGETKATFSRTEADAWAAAAGAPVEFVAGGKTYTTIDEANNALLGAIRQQMQTMLTVMCVNEKGEAIACTASEAKMTKEGQKMTYRVANHDFASREAADAFLGKVNARLASLQMLDDQGKPVDGCAVEYSKSSHCKSIQVGEKKFENPMEANITFAQEQLRLLLTTEA